MGKKKNAKRRKNAPISRDAYGGILVESKPKQGGERREMVVVLDPGFNVIDAVDPKHPDLETEQIPILGPLTVTTSTYHELERAGRVGNPEVYERGQGRQKKRDFNQPLSVSMADIAGLKKRLTKT